MLLSYQSWFPENVMKLNDGKSYLFAFGTIQSNIEIEVAEAIVEESSEEKLLGVMKILVSKVIFQAYIQQLARKCRPLLEYPHLWIMEDYGLILKTL